jgi:hypothetical protein
MARFPSCSGVILAILRQAEQNIPRRPVAHERGSTPVCDAFHHLIDKALAQDQDLFIIASSVGDPARHPASQPSRASMRPALNRTRHATAAADTALRSFRVARFVVIRNLATPFPIPL